MGSETKLIWVDNFMMFQIIMKALMYNFSRMFNMFSSSDIGLLNSIQFNLISEWGNLATARGWRWRLSCGEWCMASSGDREPGSWAFDLEQDGRVSIYRLDMLPGTWGCPRHVRFTCHTSSMLIQSTKAMYLQIHSKSKPNSLCLSQNQTSARLINSGKLVWTRIKL